MVTVADTNGPGATASGSTAASGGAVSPQDIWNALLAAGASVVSAAAIMGNAIAESGLNPEAHVTDSNGYPSYGLLQWNTASYPQASTLVTGNPAKDMAAQVTFMAQTGAFNAASGTTVSQAASNFAANYERCATCQPGGASNTARQSFAATVAGWAAAGNWPASYGSGSTSAQLTAADQAQSTSTNIWSIHLPLIGDIPILTKTQGRAILAGAILMGGSLIVLVGVGWLMGTQTGLFGAAQKVTGLAAAPATGGKSLALTAAAEESAQERNTASQYRRQRRARENYARDEEDKPPF